MGDCETDIAICIFKCLEGEGEYQYVVILNCCLRSILFGECGSIDYAVVEGLNFGAFFVFFVEVVVNLGEVRPAVRKNVFAEAYYAVVFFFVKIVGENELFEIVVKFELNEVDTDFGSDVLNGNGNGDFVACLVGFGSVD